MNNIYVLQIGTEDWRKRFKVPGYVSYTFVDEFVHLPRNSYDVVFVDRKLSLQEVDKLYKVTKAHALFVSNQVDLRGRIKWLFDCKAGKRFFENTLEDFFQNEIKYYYDQSFGANHNILNLAISDSFKGEVCWSGNHNVALVGNFGEQMTQVAFWRENIQMHKHQELDLWLQYKKTEAVELSLEVIQFATGSMSDIVNRWLFLEEDMKQVVTVDCKKGTGPIFVSVRAKGEGTLEIQGLHGRSSRGKHGHYLPGGKRHVTLESEEIFTYLDPGNLKPPLNVYFSGYNAVEKFEGYRLMKMLDCPFLLISDNRLEGGAFYMGSKEYEKLLADLIRENITRMGFSSKEVSFWGISMGACGAMYYGALIRPHALILGKPLFSLGDMALGERRQRPGGFPASLDVLLYLGQNTDDEAVKKLNDRFWDRYKKADWSLTKILIAYMLEDDYDATAYDLILSNLNSENAEVCGKGIRGRHNDDTRAVVAWLNDQYKRMLMDEFERGTMW